MILNLENSVPGRSKEMTTGTGRRKTINLDEYKTVTATTHGVLNELELKYLTKIACKLGGM